MVKTFSFIIGFFILRNSLYYCFQYNPFTVLVNANVNLSFSCCLYRKEIQVKWTKSSSDLNFWELQNDTIHTISLNGTLHIKHVQGGHAYYRCVLLFSDEIIFDKLFQIVTIDPLSSTHFVHPTPIFTIVKPFIVTSSLKRDTENQFVWFGWTNDKMYNMSTFIDPVDMFDNSIRVRRLPINSDFSLVSCLLGKGLSTTFYSCDRPHFIRYSEFGSNRKLLYFEIGDQVIIRCQSHDDSGGYLWLKDGETIRFSERIKSYGDILQIIDTVPQDQGHYQCRSQKPSTMPFNLSIFLINFYNSLESFETVVKAKEDVNSLHLPNTFPLSKGAGDIICDVHVVHPVISHLSLTFHYSDGRLSPHGMALISAGSYDCIIRNSNNNVQSIVSFFFPNSNKESVPKSKHIHLKKRSAEEVSPVLVFNFTALSNSITIHWSPPPMPVKSYTFNWGNLYPGPHKKVIDGKQTKFVIDSLVPETNYFIKIDADTFNGTLKSILHPFVTKKENKEILLTIPINLKVLEIGDLWSKISWDYRDNVDSINKTFYQVAFYPIRGQTGAKRYINTTSTEIIIKNISPATTYEFMVRVCVKNASKCSDWSMVAEFTSQETKPSDPPQQLTLSSIQLKHAPEGSLNKNMFAIQMSWQPPKRPNGEIKNYIILVTADKKLDIDNWGERTVSGKTLNTVIDRLDLNRYYYFRIGCSNEYGKSPFSTIRIFKTPDESGKNGGPVILSKEYIDPLEINEEMKVQVSNDKGNDHLSEKGLVKSEKGVIKSEKLPLTNHKWWIIIGIVVGVTLVFIAIILFLVANKCRNESVFFEKDVKASKQKKISNIDYRKQKNEVAKFVNKTPVLTTPDLFRHTNDQNCHQNYLELDERTGESPNLYSPNKAFSSQNHNQQNYRGIPGHYTPPGLIHQPNVVMTTSQFVNNPNERQFYQVPFLHHMGHNPLNVFTNSAPRVNAAASDFNSINVPSPASGYSDFTNSQATALYETSTAKSSGGKSSLSGSGSYNNGLGNKTSLINDPICERFNSTDKGAELKQSKSNDDQNLISKAFSSEELSQEMANLEGLMKDLNSITQKEFEC